MVGCDYDRFMSIWLLSLFFLAHPLNFLSESDEIEEEVMDEEEDEDLIVIPTLNREGEDEYEDFSS